MKLSALIPFTSENLGIPFAQVKTVARVLQPAGLISLGGRGPGGADMTSDDMINLLLGVCGVEVANRAADHVRMWRQLIRSDDVADERFAFTRAKTVKEFFIGLITKDLNGGALDSWLRESAGSFARFPALKAHPRHQMALDFYVDAFSLTLVVSRIVLNSDDRDPAIALERAKSEAISVKFIRPIPNPDQPSEPKKAGAQLIRRLDDETIRAWGTCLLEGTAA
ncbi:MAG: hypothetical protein WBF99_06290 [Xanthobacteraceae bacterium]